MSMLLYPYSTSSQQLRTKLMALGDRSLYLDDRPNSGDLLLLAYLL